MFIGLHFSVWEHHVDCSFALLALLEMTVNYELVHETFTTKILLSPSADVCRAAHKAMCQIARSRASTFITTIGKFHHRITVHLTDEN